MRVENLQISDKRSGEEKKKLSGSSKKIYKRTEKEKNNNLVHDMNFYETKLPTRPFFSHS